MKLLVIRDQQRFAIQLRRLVDQREEDIIPIPVAWEAIGDSIDINKLIEQQQPDYLVCAVHLPIDSTKQSLKKFKQVVEQLERSSRKYSLPFVFISSGAVFDGSRLSYEEEDEYSPLNSLGKLYAELEALIKRKVRKHIILRTTWLFSSAGENFLSSVIDYAIENQRMSLDSAGKGCPTAIQDIARVVLAILLQIDCGAKNWGVYHYASSDTALGFQFIEAIVALASQYNETIDSRELRFEHSEEGNPRFYFEPVVLNCHKLLENFGIHQRPWRSVLGATVREHFELLEQELEEQGH